LPAVILKFPRMIDRLPNRIRELRNAQGWKLTELAERLGCSVTQASDLETGKRQLTQQWAVRIARVFDVGPGDLFLPEEGGTDLSPDELRLVSLFRHAGEGQREQMLRMAEILSPTRKVA
jgi:transcriptional regulator with XRE-family HTH domain